MDRVFDTGKIIEVKFDKESLMSFLVRLDMDDHGNQIYPTDKLADVIMRALPQYAFAYNDQIDNINAISKLKEAANKLYATGDYQILERYYLKDDESVAEEAKKLEENGRGEFGEVLLHLLLCDFKGTLPLMSKIYFKDSKNVAAHGFDAVHFSPETMTMWVGESKLYGNCNQGLNALVSDLKEHFTTDFLHEQFLIIKNNVENESYLQQRDAWIKKLDQCELLSDMISNLNVVLLCIYPFDYYNKILSNDEVLFKMTPEEYYKRHIKEKKEYFDKNNDAPLAKHLKITLFLFPIRDKKEFVKTLHKKLFYLQNI